MTVQLQQRGEISSALELQTIFTPICNYLQTTAGELLLALVPLLVEKTEIIYRQSSSEEDPNSVTTSCTNRWFTNLCGPVIRI